jgi:DNA-binding XRE family transcriptional regulator
VSGAIITARTDTFTFDPDIFPRAGVDKALVDEYADALRSGAEFPPIEVLDDGRIVGGVHRWHAHVDVGLNVRAVTVTPPDGVPLVVFAAGLNVRNGKRQPKDEVKALVLDQARLNPDVSQLMLAETLGLTRSTVQRWVAPITQSHDRTKKLKAALLLDAGWTQAKVGDELKVRQQTVADWVPELPKWADSVTDQVDAAVATMSDTAAEAVAPMVDEWRNEASLRDRDERDAARLRMAIGGWDQLRKFANHKRRQQVLELLSESDRKTLTEMEASLA